MISAQLLQHLRSVAVKGGKEALELVNELERLHRALDRDPLCLECFRERNKSEGIEPDFPRDDSFWTGCNQCGKQCGER